MDGVCYPSDAQAGLCAEGAIRPQEGNTAIQLAAMINKHNREILSIRVPNWDSIPQNEREKIILAAYNGGLGGIRNAVIAAQNKYGDQATWNQVQEILQKGRSMYTLNWCQAVIYPDNVFCYASGGSGCTIQLAQTVNNECVP